MWPGMIRARRPAAHRRRARLREAGHRRRQRHRRRARRPSRARLRPGAGRRIGHASSRSSYAAASSPTAAAPTSSPGWSARSAPRSCCSSATRCPPPRPSGSGWSTGSSRTANSTKTARAWAERLAAGPTRALAPDQAAGQRLARLRPRDGLRRRGGRPGDQHDDGRTRARACRAFVGTPRPGVPGPLSAALSSRYHRTTSTTASAFATGEMQ